jgi:uncharacterized membrane protein YtjA (UPF0391 family)
VVRGWRSLNLSNNGEMLSQALVFLSVGIIAGLPSLAGMTGVATLISGVLLVIGILLLVMHLVWRDGPPTG